MNFCSRFISSVPIVVSVGLCAQIPASWPENYPAWWYNADDPENGVIDASFGSFDQDNYGFANLGQAKHIFSEAYRVMEAAEAGSAGAVIPAMLDSFSLLPEDNYVPLKIGQLKALAAPFYDVFHENGYRVVLSGGDFVSNGTYPWTSNVTTTNAALANIGQLKHLFSFELLNWPPTPEIVWDEIPEYWKQGIINGPSAAFYDPDGTITATSQLLGEEPAVSAGLDSKTWDYDGDGISNLQEYIDGSDPVDFFNGAPAKLRAIRGDSQTASPDTWMSEYLIVSVTDAMGANWSGAPVRFSVNGGYSGLATDFANSDRYQTILVKRGFGSRVAFEAPANTGTSRITAALPNGESLTFTVYTVDAAAKSRQGVTDFKELENADGTITYTWQAAPAAGDFFKLQKLQADGTWLVFYETTYGSSDLPYSAGQTEFSLTLPNL